MTLKEGVAKALDGKGPFGTLTVRFIVVLVIISTLSFAFSTVKSLEEKYEAAFTFCEFFTTLAFSFEYMLRLWTSPDGFGYCVQPIALVDLASILPSWIDAFLPGDNFPALQFLRMLRIFKFLSASKRGEKGMEAFKSSWEDNKSIIYAASMAGGAVWLVTASLQYLAERDNPEMLWCYPPPAPGKTLPLMGSEHSGAHTAHSIHEHEHAAPKIDCACDGDGCSGADCLCQQRFRSIPSAMFLVILNLSGEFPLADQASFYGRIIGTITAVMSVAVFAIPTGLVGAALEGAVGALNAGDEKDYDVDDDDAAEIAAEAQEDAEEVMMSPEYTKTLFYKRITGVLVLLGAVCSVLSTVKGVRAHFGHDSVTGFVMFYAVNVFMMLFFLSEWVMRVLQVGVKTLLYQLLWDSSSNPMVYIDFYAWSIDAGWLCHSLWQSHSAKAAVSDAATKIGEGLAPTWHYFPAYVALCSAVVRMVKFERYIHGFKILHRVLERSYGVLAIGGMAAAVVTVFSSTLMYYAERNNPDPNMAKYYDSVPMAMWVTLLNLSGEAPLCDYTTYGSIIVGTLSISACAIFAIPVGALGSGFEAVISEIHNEEGVEDEGMPLLPTSAIPATAGATEMTSYGAVSQSEEAASQLNSAGSDDNNNNNGSSSSSDLQRMVEGRGQRGERFLKISLFATLFAVSLEVLSTVDYAKLVPTDGKQELGFAGLFWSFMPSNDAHDLILSWCEFVVVAWFTLEYITRFTAHGTDYVFSMLGAVDFVSTFPYFLARGLLGSSIAKDMDVYDGPLRALRVLRLIRLDTYVPSLTLIDDACRRCWSGLRVAIFATICIWFGFNIVLFYAEKDDVIEGEDKRFRNALSSLQYSGVLLTGDYPIVDFSLKGKLACSAAVVVAVGIVAVPASILAGAFVELLQEQAEARREERRLAATKMQNIFLRKRANMSSKEAKSAQSLRQLRNVVKDAIRHSAALRGLDDADSKPFFAKICIWKNNLHDDHEHTAGIFGMTGATYKDWMTKLVFLNIVAVVLESIPEVERFFPHSLWQTFEAASVILFSIEYIINLGTARFDPKFNFSRWEYMSSFIGKADLLSIVPFYVQTMVIPFWLGNDSVYGVDATIFRVLRLARILEFDVFFEAFTLLREVFNKAAPVLTATGVLALILWVGSATAFYYTSPLESEVKALGKQYGSEDPAAFTSIVDALYFTSIFMAGEWCKVDFTPIGSVICVVLAMVGVALFSIPVGVLFEGFQDMLEEKHGKKDKED